MGGKVELADLAARQTGREGKMGEKIPNSTTRGEGNICMRGFQT